MTPDEYKLYVQASSEAKDYVIKLLDSNLDTDSLFIQVYVWLERTFPTLRACDRARIMYEKVVLGELFKY